jgi:hypothetical protein
MKKIELNLQRMIIYKNIGLDNIRKKRKKEKKKRITTFGDVCWFFNIFKSMFKNSYIFLTNGTCTKHNLHTKE